MPRSQQLGEENVLRLGGNVNVAMSELSKRRHLWKLSRNQTLKFKTMLPENLMRQKTEFH